MAGGKSRRSRTLREDLGWFVHNVIGHPLSELFYWLQLRRGGKLSAWFHDVTIPAGHDAPPSKNVTQLSSSEFADLDRARIRAMPIGEVERLIKEGRHI